VGATTTTLYALRGDDGVSVWSRQIQGVDYQSAEDLNHDPAVLAADDGRLFVNEADGDVHALRAGDGAQVWRASGGVGTIGAGGGILYQRGTLEKMSIIALRESNGERLWVDPFASVHGMAVSGNRVVAVTMSITSNNLAAFLTDIDASTGKVLWRSSIQSTDPVPLASHGVVYFTDFFTLYAFRIGDGHVLWHEQVPDRTNSWFDVVASSAQTNVLFVITNPFVGEDPLFDPDTCSCLPLTKVYALNAQDGSAYWQYVPPVTSSTEGFLQIDVSQ
jgi:outer membrane protein assembly factor BamB